MATEYWRWPWINTRWYIRSQCWSQRVADILDNQHGCHQRTQLQLRYWNLATRLPPAAERHWSRDDAMRKHKAERIVANVTVRDALLRMYLCELCDSKQRGKDRLLHLRGNGQGVEVSTQHGVKVTPTRVCLHQAGHGAGDDEHRRARCVWLQNGCN